MPDITETAAALRQAVVSEQFESVPALLGAYRDSVDASLAAAAHSGEAAAILSKTKRLFHDLMQAARASRAHTAARRSGLATANPYCKRPAGAVQTWELQG